MLRHALLAALLIVAVPAPGAHADDKFQLKSVNVDLPFGDRMFPDRAGSDSANNNCLACHSAGMVLTQHNLSKATWAGVVDKLIHAYKAPVAETDVPAIVDYLTETKGSK